MLNDSQAWSSCDGVEMAPWTKTSVDVAGAGGEGAGAGCTKVVAGADDVALCLEHALQQISVLWAL